MVCVCVSLLRSATLSTNGYAGACTSRACRLQNAASSLCCERGADAVCRVRDTNARLGAHAQKLGLLSGLRGLAAHTYRSTLPKPLSSASLRREQSKRLARCHSDTGTQYTCTSRERRHRDTVKPYDGNKLCETCLPHRRPLSSFLESHQAHPARRRADAALAYAPRRGARKTNLATRRPCSVVFMVANTKA